MEVPLKWVKKNRMSNVQKVVKPKRKFHQNYSKQYDVTEIEDKVACPRSTFLRQTAAVCFSTNSCKYD